jgi:MFS family permease
LFTDVSLLPLPLRAAATTTFRSLRVRNFRLFWFGQMVSVSGTWMQTVAQNWLVLSLTGSGVALGVTVALQFLPMLLFGMWGGLVADRFDRRRVLFVTQVVPLVLALVMFVLVGTGVVALWMVYALAFLLGLVFMVDMPTRQSFVIEMVGPDEVPNAVGLNSAMFNAGRVVGPAVAGVLIATVGIASTFLVNAASYLAVLAALAAMRPAELFPQQRADRGPGAIRAGLRYVWSTPVLRSTLLLVAVIGTFGMNFTVVLPILARYTFDGGAPLYGWLTSLMSAGSLLGALTAAGRVGPTRTMLVVSGAAFGALTLVAAMAPSPVLTGAALVAVGVAIMLFLATANTTLQLACEPAMRGRVMALYGLVFLGSTPLGGPFLGWLSGEWGGRWGLAFSGAVSLAAALVAAAPAVARRWRGRSSVVADSSAPLSTG